MDLMKGKKLLKADRTSVDAEAALQGKVTVNSF